MPVQRVALAWSKARYTWDRTFFTRRGFETKYADFAMLQWTLHVSNVSTIMFWPEATSKPEKMKAARVLVEQRCGDLLYEKTISVNRNGVASLAFHAYGNQVWLTEKIKQLQFIYNKADDEEHPISILFVRPTSMSHLKTCKDKLRSQFALWQPKSSVHIPDYREEVVLVAEMVLNPNSVLFLNRHHDDNCQKVASEVAVRLHLTAVNPESFLLPQDLMVDSGAVMSFFGLRKRTDVDLLFQGDVEASILGKRNGILVEAHAFEHSQYSSARAWGAEHLLDCTVHDLFADPRYYGYCHGMKYVSLEQLIRYKQRRGEVTKDNEDVLKMQRFIAGTHSQIFSGNIWLCGENWNYPHLATALFGNAWQSIKRESAVTSEDLLLYGAGSKCSKLTSFPGSVITFNGEPPRPPSLPPKANHEQFYLGAWLDTTRNHVPVYNVALRYEDLRVSSPEHFDHKGLPQRLTNTREYFLIYTAKNCVTFREEAFRKVQLLGKAHVGGKCSSDTSTTSPFTFSRGNGVSLRKNPSIYAHYRFVLCMENTYTHGYITEKLLYAFVGGSIPIYYGTKEVFQVFNKAAFIYYDIKRPQSALDRLAYLEANRTAYAEVLSEPILADGQRTLEEYFSLSDDVGGGKLKQRILDMLFGSSSGVNRG